MNWGNTETFQNYSMFRSTANTDYCVVAFHCDCTIIGMSKQQLVEYMQLITATKSKLPSWYGKVEENYLNHVYGQAIIWELDNLHAIVAQCLFNLKSQDGHNLMAKTRETGTTPISANTKFSIVDAMASRVLPISTRSPALSVLYSCVMSS